MLERDSMLGDGVVDVRLLLWMLWLGGCCQVPASQAAMAVVPCVLEAVCVGPSCSESPLRLSNLWKLFG